MTTTNEAPIATKTPFFLPLSKQVRATVILTNPGGITPTNDAKKVTKKSLVVSKSTKALANFKLNVSYRFILF